MPKEELLDEIGIPLSPVRLKCALLGLGVLKVALHRSKGTPLPEEWGTSSSDISVIGLAMSEIEVCPLAELPPGTVRIVDGGSAADSIGVYNCDGSLFAIEDRCSHDDGPLCEGDFDCAERIVICPRHGARFDLETGRALTLPAYIDVDTFPVRVRDDGVVVVDA